MTSEQRKSLKVHAAERRIELTYCIGLPAKYDIASLDDLTRRNGIEFLQQQAVAIGEMGGESSPGLSIALACHHACGGTDKRPIWKTVLKYETGRQDC